MSQAGPHNQGQTAGTPSQRSEIARQSYRAFADANRRFFEDHLSHDFTFSSPPDPRLDRAGWFEPAGREPASIRSLGSSAWSRPAMR